MKRSALSFFLRLIPVLCLVALAACKSPEPEDGSETTPPEAETGPLRLWNAGTVYKIMYHEEEDENLAHSCASTLSAAIQAKAGRVIPVLTENQANANLKLISVGMTARAEVQEYLALPHDTFDYAIFAKDRRLFIVGASGWSLKYATDRFIREYVQPGKDVSEDMNLQGNCRGERIFPLENGANLRLLDNNIWSYNSEVIPDAWAALGGDPRNSTRSKQYAAMVHALMPDVFAWQEYAAAMKSYVEPMVADKYAEAVPDVPPGDHNRTPLFYNKETVEPVTVHYFLFPGEFNNSNSKSYTAAIFRHRATDSRFIVVGTHLWYKSESEQAGSNNARTQQAQFIAEEVAGLLKKYDCPVFVMGDMNCKLSSDAMKVFTGRGYQDCGISATGYKDSFKGHHTCSESAGFSWSPQSNDNCANSIDHIFEYNCSGKAKVISHRITTAAWTICLTDHCPRYIDVALGSGAGEPAVRPDPKPVADAITLQDASLKVLFIGNSFTKDAVEHLPAIVSAAGITDVTMAHLYYGGRVIPSYNDWSLADYTLYKAEKGASSWTTHGSEVRIDQVATGGRWDVITIQEHTGNFRAWSWTDDEKTAVKELLAKLDATQKVEPTFHYILSQAYFNMDKIASGSKPYITWTDQAGMWKVIAEQGKKVLAQTDVKEIISTGCALQNLRTSGLDTPLNLTRDGYHMDYGAARYAAACTVYGKIIEPFFHKGLDDNSFRISTLDVSEGYYTTPVTDESAPVCRKAARYAIENPFEVTDMKGEGGSSGPGGDQHTFQGKGTKDEPYLVATAGDMKGISSVLALNKILYFRMTADIDMSSVQDWTPVVTEDKAYGIHFDGGNHTITGFTCKDKVFASLFGLIHGTVSNLRLKDCSVSSDNQCALLGVWGGNGIGTCTATVSHVHAENCTVSMTSKSATVAGGLIANACALTLTDSSFQGTVSSAATSGAQYFGGLVGKVARSGVVIERCHADVQLKCTAGNQIGGLVGSTAKDCSVMISDCYTTGAVTGKGSYLGGIVGDLGTGSTVQRCYSTMSLTGGYNMGGIVGRASNLSNPNTNGTFNSLMGITVKDCIAWNPSIKTSGSGDDPAKHYSSGAVVGFTVYRNALSGCWRRSDLTFKAYSNAAYNILEDNDDVSSDKPLVKPSSDTYHCPYNGKTAPAGSTVSSLAQGRGWNQAVWDFSTELPTLK